MADEELDPASKHDFVKALATTMHADGARRKRGYLMAGAGVMVIAAGAAVAIGAAGSHKPAATASGTDLSGLNSTSVGQATPGAAQPGSGHRPAAAHPVAKNAPRPKAAGAGPVPVALLPGSGGSDAQPQAGAPVSSAHSSSLSSSSGGTGVQSAAPKQAAAASSAAPKQAAAASVSFEVTGQVSCVSGKSVEGVWVSAASGSAFASWKGLGNGSTSDWWLTLPKAESYSLHVGCGGSTSSWAVATYSPTVSGGHNSFNCYDVSGPKHGQCVPR